MSGYPYMDAENSGAADMEIQQRHICMCRGIWVFFPSLSFIASMQNCVIVLKKKLLSLNILLCAIIIHKQCNVQPLHVLISS